MHLPGHSNPAPIRESSTTVALHGKPLTLHVAQPDAQRSRAHAFVLYASGDGGWFGAAVEMWRQMAVAGYAVVGFSSRAFLKVERPKATLLDPAQVAREYSVIIDRARTTLGLEPSTPVILTGWSRGAAFSVLVAAEPGADPGILGVVAIGLAEGEDLRINGADDETDEGSAGAEQRPWPYHNYEQLARVSRACAVIQATHDNYFPAADARQRFGADGVARRFYAIDAENHRFSGGKVAFRTALVDAMGWIDASFRLTP